MSKQRLPKSALTRKQMGKVVAERLEITGVKGAAAVDMTLDLISEALARGERIELRGLGTFEPRIRPAGMARNVRQGGVVATPARRVVKFKLSKLLSKVDDAA